MHCLKYGFLNLTKEKKRPSSVIPQYFEIPSAWELGMFFFWLANDCQKIYLNEKNLFHIFKFYFSIGK
jgi:hypothetical protein